MDGIHNVKKMYDELTYFDQYGGSFVLFILITIMLLVLISYFRIMSEVQPIINDWSNQRCKPNIMPIAGFINRPENMTASEYTAQNFTYCTQNILSSISGNALQPLTFITASLQSVTGDIQQSIQSIRGMFDKLRTSMQNVSEEIMGKIMNVMIALMQIIISFRDLIGKIQGTMTASLFTALGGYYTLKSLMGVIAQFIVTILVTLAVLIAGLWAVPFTWGAAAANTVIFTAIAIPMAIILAFMSKVLKINTHYNIPKIKCFDKNTQLRLNDGTVKRIYQVQVGDVLSNNNKVTAKIKVATEGSIMYSLNHVIVSDSHIVKISDSPEVWDRVDRHPNAVKCASYTEPYLYCLNTSNKSICINETMFTDWDEIYGEKASQLSHILPTYVETGFTQFCKVETIKGNYVSIDKIQINDTLDCGEKVYGVVEIDGHPLGEKIGYHLLTFSGIFKTQDMVVNDYNAGIDFFLQKNIIY
jgi:hypothetical protein